MGIDNTAQDFINTTGGGGGVVIRRCHGAMPQAAALADISDCEGSIIMANVQDGHINVHASSSLIAGGHNSLDNVCNIIDAPATGGALVSTVLNHKGSDKAMNHCINPANNGRNMAAGLRQFAYWICTVVSMVVVFLTLMTNFDHATVLMADDGRLPGSVEHFLFHAEQQQHLSAQEDVHTVVSSRTLAGQEVTADWSNSNHIRIINPNNNNNNEINPTTVTAAHRISPARRDALWSTPAGDVAGYQQCLRQLPSKKKLASETNGYLVVSSNGGLNQMRNGICDMVAIAKIMNATLVIPRLDHTSFWADPSKFDDIFDVTHFMRTLEHDVAVVQELPVELAAHEPSWKAPISWSKSSYYKREILPILKQHGVVYFSHTDSRLTNNDLPPSLQMLRCRACYQALTFTQSIEELGSQLVARMQAGGNPYIALHLRYEKDMLAFTGCSHSLGEAEAEELAVMRRTVPHWKEKDIDGEARRLEGGCPLTPREAALFMKGLGFPQDTRIYIVAGPIFGNGSLDNLRVHFPNIFTHSSLATQEELLPFHGFQNRLAALDYMVALHSDVFVHTFDGNMAKAIQGHRRFHGHLKTISPDRKGIVKFVDDFEAERISWKSFEKHMQQLHKRRMGGPELREKKDSPKSEESFYANPFPGCICKNNTF